MAFQPIQPCVPLPFRPKFAKIFSITRVTSSVMRQPIRRDAGGALAPGYGFGESQFKGRDEMGIEELKTKRAAEETAAGTKTPEAAKAEKPAKTESEDVWDAPPVVHHGEWGKKKAA